MPQPLAKVARDKIDAGALPLDRPPKLWAGQGSGGSCAAGDQPILSSQVEFEPQYEGRAAFRLHVGCHGLWEAERHRRGYLPDD